MKPIHEFTGQEGKIVLTITDHGSCQHAVLEVVDAVCEKDQDAFFSWLALAKRRLFTKPTLYDDPGGKMFFWPDHGKTRAVVVTSQCALLWFE